MWKMARLWTALMLALRREPNPRSGRLVFFLGGVALILSLTGALRDRGGSPFDRLSDLSLPLMLLAVGGADLLRPNQRDLAASLRATGLVLAIFTLVTSFPL